MFCSCAQRIGAEYGTSPGTLLRRNPHMTAPKIRRSVEENYGKKTYGIDDPGRVRIK